MLEMMQQMMMHVENELRIGIARNGRLFVIEAYHK